MGHSFISMYYHRPHFVVSLNLGSHFILTVAGFCLFLPIFLASLVGSVEMSYSSLDLYPHWYH